MSDTRGSGLSFESCAEAIARVLEREGEGAAEHACAQFERNIAWDRHKLFKRAQELLSQSPGSK